MEEADQRSRAGRRPVPLSGGIFQEPQMAIRAGLRHPCHSYASDLVVGRGKLRLILK